MYYMGHIYPLGLYLPYSFIQILSSIYDPWSELVIFTEFNIIIYILYCVFARWIFYHWVTFAASRFVCVFYIFLTICLITVVYILAPNTCVFVIPCSNNNPFIISVMFPPALSLNFLPPLYMPIWQALNNLVYIALKALN